MEEIRRLDAEGAECCRFYRMITDVEGWSTHEEQDLDGHGAQTQDIPAIEDNDLNTSQLLAVNESQRTRVSLVWGPPGGLFSSRWRVRLADNSSRNREDDSCSKNIKGVPRESSGGLEDSHDRIDQQRWARRSCTVHNLLTRT